VSAVFSLIFIVIAAIYLITEIITWISKYMPYFKKDRKTASNTQRQSVPIDLKHGISSTQMNPSIHMLHVFTLVPCNAETKVPIVEDKIELV
jgi:hypothetical protein